MSVGARRRIAAGGSAMLSPDSAHCRLSPRLDTRTNQSVSAVSTSSPTPSRANRNGAFNHAAFSGTG